MADELAVWAWSRPGVANFGDELGPAILARLGYRVRRVELREAELVSCGSIIEVLNRRVRDGLIVWGSGLMIGGPCRTGRLDVRAVRGRLTAGKLGVDVPLGDPGILVPQLWDRPPVRHGVGVVRHFLDRRPYPWADLVVDSTEPVDEVITAIGSCAAVAASSLHGLIVAQAWSIPTMRLAHDEIIGGDYKYADYLSGLADANKLVDVLP